MDVASIGSAAKFGAGFAEAELVISAGFVAD
jgi:hypothetical protein